MAMAAGLDYWNDAFETLAQLAARVGGAAKPSGAGGGDCAIALFRDEGAEAAFIADATRTGFTVIPIRLAPGAAPEVSDVP